LVSKKKRIKKKENDQEKAHPPASWPKIRGKTGVCPWKSKFKSQHHFISIYIWTNL